MGYGLTIGMGKATNGENWDLCGGCYLAVNDLLNDHRSLNAPG